MLVYRPNVIHACCPESFSFESVGLSGLNKLWFILLKVGTDDTPSLFDSSYYSTWLRCVISLFYLGTDIFSSWNRMLIASLSPAFGNRWRRRIIASCMLSGVWACLRVRNRPISVRQILNVVSLICQWLSMLKYYEEDSDLEFTHPKPYVSLSICFSNNRSIIPLSVRRISQYFRILAFNSSVSGAKNKGKI